MRKNCELKFITTADAIGHETYKRSLCFLLVKAVHDVAGHDKIERVRIHFSVDKGYYCTVDGDIKLQSSSLRMWRSGCVGSQMKKFRLKRRQFIQMMRSNYFTDMECMIRKNYLNTGGFQKVNIYSINEFEDYYYGYMVPDTGYLKYFSLHLYDEGFVIQMPVKEQPEKRFPNLDQVLNYFMY